MLKDVQRRMPVAIVDARGCSGAEAPEGIAVHCGSTIVAVAGRRALPDGIEGYTPVAGEQHVVRVKRFEQAGTEHFVLDLIIETRTVQ